MPNFHIGFASSYNHLMLSLYLSIPVIVDMLPVLVLSMENKQKKCIRKCKRVHSCNVNRGNHITHILLSAGICIREAIILLYTL